jgi:hypothetical protein
MPLTVPTLDGRRYADLLREAQARIPVHNPEWINFNDSDPGITLLQLFAFMTENLLYRSNLIPERNRLKFLQLLGIPLRPATAAQGVVTFSNERGPLETITLPGGIPVLAGRIGFATANGLDVLPIEGRVFFRRSLTAAERQQAEVTYAQIYGSFQDGFTQLDFYKTEPFDAPTSAAAIKAVNLADDSTVDRSLWLALLARPGEEGRTVEIRHELAGKTLTLGLMPAVDDPGRVLHPGGLPAAQPPAPLLYELSAGTLASNRTPQYRSLDARADANPLEDVTLVQLVLPQATEFGTFDNLEPLEDGVGDFPPLLEDAQLATRVIAWIRVRMKPDSSGAAAPAGMMAKFSWLGINASKVSQRIAVHGERLGTGTGAPDQSFTVVNTPVIPESVVVTVDGTAWRRIDDLFTAPPEVPVRDPSAPPGAATQAVGDPRVFVGDRESGTIRFGDGLRGARPPAGSGIFVDYAYGGGRAGNVGIGALKDSSQLPAGFKVSNPLPAWGGDESETAADGERNIPRVLRHRDRAVSAADFKDIVSRTPGIELGRVEVVPLFHPDAGSPVPGVVTVLVIPDDPSHPEAPIPNQFFLKAVCQQLETARLLTTEVFVRGPDYIPVSVSVGVEVVPGKDIAVVREAVKQAVRNFLSPMVGGIEGLGWPLERNVEDREVLVAVARVDGVAEVRQVLLWSGTAGPLTNIQIQNLELPRLDLLGVAIGDPEDLHAAPPPPPAKRSVPIPVLPKEC